MAVDCKHEKGVSVSVWQKSFEKVWQYRETELYPSLFGSLRDSIAVLGPTNFAPFGVTPSSIDPRWLSCGVLVSPPCEKHASWLYVSSGLSNAWHAQFDEDGTCVDADDDEAKGDGDSTEETCDPILSGIGCEFIFETTEDAPWAIQLVQNIMVFQMLLNRGHFGDKPLLGPEDRIPIRSPIKPGSDSCLRSLLLLEPANFTRTFTLPTGLVHVFALVGVSEPEVACARADGGEHLRSLLIAAAAYPITDPTRTSVL